MYVCVYTYLKVRHFPRPKKKKKYLWRIRVLAVACPTAVVVALVATLTSLRM